MWNISTFILVTRIDDVDRRLYTIHAEIPSPLGSLETMVEVFVEEGLCDLPKAGSYYFTNGSFVLMTESIYVLKAYTFTEARQFVYDWAPMPVLNIAGHIVKKEEPFLEVQCNVYSRIKDKDEPVVLKVHFRPGDWARFEKALWKGKDVHMVGWMENWTDLVALGFSVVRSEYAGGSDGPSTPRAVFSPRKVIGSGGSGGASKKGHGGEGSKAAGKRIRFD
jgi:hypothetical protein